MSQSSSYLVRIGKSPRRKPESELHCQTIRIAAADRVDWPVDFPCSLECRSVDFVFAAAAVAGLVGRRWGY